MLPVLAVAVAFRLYALGRLPGINGDEAWYGVLAARLGHAPGWITPSGNVPSPFQLVPLTLLAHLASPDFALLRVPSVLASLAQLALTFAVARRHFGRGAAVVALVLTSALPIQIAYARFGWDPSHSGLVTIVALHAVLQRRLRASAALFALAVWVHPTNVFLVPFLLTAGVFAQADWRRPARWLGRAALIGGAATLAVLVLLTVVGGSGARTTAILLRIVDPRSWARFALQLARLLDGDTVLTYITGSGLGRARLAVDLGVLAALAALAALGGPRLRAQPVKLGVVLGTLAMLIAFHVVAGPDALRPHFERYGLCLMVPTILTVAILAVEVTGEAKAIVAVVALAAVALFGFWRGYFVELERTGSTSHPTFWTGPREPKAEAFRLIAADARGQAAPVIAEGYWLTGPLAYLAGGTNLDVREAAEPLEPPPPGAYLVGFADGAIDRWARPSPTVRLRWEIAGAGGRVVLRVWRVEPGR